MAIVLSEDDKIVMYVNSYPYADFRDKFLNGVARCKEFSSVLEDKRVRLEDLTTLRDLMVEAGIPEKLLVTDRQIKEAAQAIMDRIVDSLHR